MGARSFCHSIFATSAGAGFDALYSNAVRKHGTDMYNGTISTCDMGRCVKTFDKPNDRNTKAAYKYISDIDYGKDTRVAYYIDLGVSHYIVRTVKKTTRKADAKYEKRFCIKDLDNKTLFSDTDSARVAAKAEQIVKSTGQDIFVTTEKIRVSGNNVIAEYTPVDKKMKSMPKNTAGKTIIPMHQYLFFGWAAE